MKKEDFKKGQTVYLVPVKFMAFDYLRVEKQIIETTVLSVGRKYMKVNYGGGICFDINNDFREVTNYSFSYRLFLSKEDIQKELQRRKMEVRLQTAFHFPAHVERKMTFEELQTVFNIVNKYSRY